FFIYTKYFILSFIFSCIKIYHNKNNKKMSGKSNIKVSDLNIPAAEEEKQNR
ncbi:hypothetical protein HMPREF1351_01272, partial [Enterococcus faecium 510]